MAYRAPEPAVTQADLDRYREQYFKQVELDAAKAMTLTSSPTNNMGGKSQKTDYAGVQKYEQLVLCDDGQVRIQMLRRAVTPDAAFIDQISFSFSEDACVEFAKRFYGKNRLPVHTGAFGLSFVSDADYIHVVSLICDQVFGFGITDECLKGMNFYKRTWKLGTDDALYGHVSFGGQRETVLIQITGMGAMAASDGWEQRLFQFLSAAPRAKITRVDLARDFLDGEYTVDMANAAYDEGAFCAGGRWPSIEHAGNWKRPDGAGRTLYLGKRKSGKFTRVYEKGRQLGCKSSEWVRLETELKSVDRIVPFDVLLYPGQYLAAVYPAFDFISATPEKIRTITKRVELTYDNAVHYAQLQVGRLINFMSEQMCCSSEQIVSLFSRPSAGYPKRLKLEQFSAGFSPVTPLHKRSHRPAFDPFNMCAQYE